MQLTKLIKTGTMIEDLWDLGFAGEKDIDLEDGEEYYNLFLDGEEVGYTEINETNGDVEIICESRPDYQKVIEKTGKDVTVWAWYNNIFTNVT